MSRRTTRRLPSLATLVAFAAALAAAHPALARPPAPTPRPETASERARRALAERDVPFEAPSFLAAAADGDAALVRLFLEAGMPASTRDQWGTSALLEAARANRAEVVALLLESGAKPGEAQGGEPPLTGAAEGGSLGAMHALLAAGADPDQAADAAKGPGGTPLQRACAAEAWEAARLLVEAGASPSLAAPSLAPPLYLASESGHAPTVALLLATGADPNARVAGGSPAIWPAVANGHAEVVRLLLLGGADVKADRAALLRGRPGRPVAPAIRQLLKNPPKAAAPTKKKPR